MKLPIKFEHLIDHTLLKPDATSAEIISLCQEAKTYNFKTVCVNSSFVKTAKKELSGSSVLVCSVVGFPLGAMSSAAKGFETKIAVEDGADEIDMVINISKLKDQDYDFVLNDIKSVVANAKGKTVKVILETCLLTDDLKVKACNLAVSAGANFVKTSTGFSSGGATVEDVKLMRQTVGPKIGVKASGGVRSLEDLEKMIEAGANRIGTSSGVKILKGIKVTSNY
jgi:deoxyribose-phosphate aldolase